MPNNAVLARLLTLAVLVGACGMLPRVDQHAADAFISAASDRPEFVGAGIIDDGRAILVTVHGDPKGVRELALRMLPRGTSFRIEEVDYSLDQLRNVAARISAEKMTPPNVDENFTEVDVDELRGRVLVGVAEMESGLTEQLRAAYGPMVDVEVRPPGTLY